MFAEGADKNWFPEAFDGIFRLAVVATPLQKRLSSVRLCGEGQGCDGAGDCELVPYRKKWKTQKRGRCVQRSRQRGGVHHAGAAAGLDEGHVIVPANFIFHSDAAVELDEVGADAEEHVLTVVHHFAGAGMLVGRGTATEIRAALKESDAEAGVRERAGRSESGEATAGDGY